jgi:hypothetical protein
MAFSRFQVAAEGLGRTFKVSKTPFENEMGLRRAI